MRRLLPLLQMLLLLHLPLLQVLCLLLMPLLHLLRARLIRIPALHLLMFLLLQRFSVIGEKGETNSRPLRDSP